MAAVLQPRPDAPSSQRPALRLVGSPGEATPPSRPVLRVVHGGRSEAARRRRRTFLLRRLAVASALTFGVVGLAGLMGGGSPESAVAVSERTHVVVSGDTLWGIAASLAPDADPRDTVDAIIDANDLGGSNALSGDADLRVGQRLVLPSSVG